MQSIVVIIIAAIAAVLVIGGIAAVTVMNADSGDGGGVSHAMSKAKEKLSGESSSQGSSGSDKNVVEIVKDEIKQNGQQGGGSYREVTYSDGGFRQYDADTGNLIGSSYDSDQKELPSLE